MQGSLLVPIIVVSIFAIVAAITDVWKYKVPNLVTFPLLISGLVYHGAVNEWAGIGNSLLGVLFGFGVLILPYLMGGMSAGDVKLMMAIGAWLGFPITLWVFVFSAFASLLVSMVMVVMNQSLVDTMQHLQIIWMKIRAFGQYFGAEESVETLVSAKDRRKRLIPFGAMVALGIIMIVLLAGFAKLMKTG